MKKKNIDKFINLSKVVLPIGIIAATLFCATSSVATTLVSEVSKDTHVVMNAATTTEKIATPIAETNKLFYKKGDYIEIDRQGTSMRNVKGTDYVLVNIYNDREADTSAPLGQFKMFVHNVNIAPTNNGHLENMDGTKRVDHLHGGIGNLFFDRSSFADVDNFIKGILGSKFNADDSFYFAFKSIAKKDAVNGIQYLDSDLSKINPHAYFKGKNYIPPKEKLEKINFVHDHFRINGGNLEINRTPKKDLFGDTDIVYIHMYDSKDADVNKPLGTLKITAGPNHNPNRDWIGKVDGSKKLQVFGGQGDCYVPGPNNVVKLMLEILGNKYIPAKGVYIAAQRIGMNANQENSDISNILVDPFVAPKETFITLKTPNNNGAQDEYLRVTSNGFIEIDRHKNDPLFNENGVDYIKVNVYGSATADKNAPLGSFKIVIPDPDLVDNKKTVGRFETNDGKKKCEFIGERSNYWINPSDTTLYKFNEVLRSALGDNYNKTQNFHFAYQRVAKKEKVNFITYKDSGLSGISKNAVFTHSLTRSGLAFSYDETTNDNYRNVKLAYAFDFKDHANKSIKSVGLLVTTDKNLVTTAIETNKLPVAQENTYCKSIEYDKAGSKVASKDIYVTYVKFANDAWIENAKVTYYAETFIRFNDDTIMFTGGISGSVLDEINALKSNEATKAHGDKLGAMIK